MFGYSITLDSLRETNSSSNYCVKSCIELSIFIWSNIFVSLSFPQLILFKFTPCTQILTLFSSDINECLVDPSPCADNAACANTDGSYACTCEEGYTGNGTYCQGNVYCILILWLFDRIKFSLTECKISRLFRTLKNYVFPCLSSDRDNRSDWKLSQ